MALGDTTRQCRDLILNNKLATFLSVALFAFIISTIALASSNQSKKEAIQECRAELSESTPRCSLTLAKDIPENEPVYLKHEGSSYKLWAPFGTSLVWNTTSEQTALLCSGTGNTLVKTGQMLSENTCSKGTNLIVAGDTVAVKELKCSAPVIGDSRTSNEPCANGRGILYRLGFDAGADGFFTYIESCFDTNRLSVLYTRHILPGGAIGSAVIADDFNNWRADGFGDKAKPDTSYTQITQVERLTKLLGTKEQAEKYVVDGKHYLTKGHLTPRGDGIFQTWKHASFFYTNAVPQWNDINEGNWNNVEGRVRSIASVLREDVIVIQGSAGVLSLPNTANQTVEISLDEFGIDVPLWTWKIVKSPSKDAGIAFVTLNNPYETTLSDQQMLCPNVCDKYGWTQKEYSDFKKGFTYCCDPNELIRMVPHTPNEGLVRNILTSDMLTSSGVSFRSCISMIVLVLLIQLFM